MPEAQEIKKELYQKALQKVLEEAKVPQVHHLKLLAEFKKHLDLHEKDRKSHQDILQKYTQHAEQSISHATRHEEQIKGYHRELERSRSIIKGEPGEPGTPGNDGEPGKDADEEIIVSKVLSKIPRPKDGEKGKDATFDEEGFTKRFITKIKKDGLLDLTHIKGAQGFIKDGVKYRFEELMRGGGTKTYFANTSGTGTITGIVNGSNTIFVLPTTSTNIKVFADGARQISTGDYTQSGSTITFVVPPISNVVVDA